MRDSNGVALWTDRQGNTKPITELENRHLLNIIKMVVAVAKEQDKHPIYIYSHFMDIWRLAESKNLPLPTEGALRMDYKKKPGQTYVDNYGDIDPEDYSYHDFDTEVF